GALIREQNEIGDDCSVGSGAVLEPGNRIGDRTRIHSQCFLEHVTLGRRVFLGPGVVFTDDPHPMCPRYLDCVLGATVEDAVGLGHWGPNYARLLSGQVPGARLVACADLREDRLGMIGTLYPQVRLHGDHRALLAAGDLDAAIVATSASTHREIVLDCLAAGLHVLVEKPLANSSEACEEVVRAVERTDRVLMVGHTFLFNPAVQRVKQLLDGGAFGRVLYLAFRRTGLGPIRQDVNALWDLAPHDLSMLRYWLDSDPLEVTARGQSYLRPGVEDVVFLTLRYP